MSVESKSYSIGSNLRRIRNAKGWSQEVLAPLAGMSQSNLSNIESNKQRVGWETVELIAGKLGVAPEDLIDAEGAIVINVETQTGTANGNHNTVHNGKAGSDAQMAHIQTLEDELRFLRLHVEALTKHLGAALEQIKALVTP